MTNLKKALIPLILFISTIAFSLNESDNFDNV